ncbi:hypothetical protein H0H81_005916 [Sphagnurus paluster]|uniref:Uncharacterized protein n=1 Tax=Sphagnurus paluster TaxID=117069 RepID=A0A9P7GQM7_9AGAR|nr:hypothetical protein H0H81_005916 [Sphagnurus paluster]
MSLLEVENTGEGIPQGVILALVGPEPGSPSTKDAESMRSLRMYNLASITSLAKWAIANKGSRPLDLHRPSNWQVQQSPSKRPRPQSGSLARSLKSLIDPPGANQSQEPSISSYTNLLSLSISTSSTPTTSTPPPLRPNRKAFDDSSWDVVDDLPLRWATDFVPLATNGSRLLNSSVLSYALWTDENRKGNGGRLLAIATKNNILLYETPRGERAFLFIKEFYTPLLPRRISFFQQSVQEVGRSFSDVGTPSRHFTSPHRRAESSTTMRVVSDSSRASGSSTATLNYGTHLSLFIVFDKKAGWIRIADSAVGELELHGASTHHPHRASDSPSTSSLLRSRMSFEVTQPKWIIPVRCIVPTPNKPNTTREVYLITRGKHTHVMPCPLPVGLASYPPLYALSWRTAPRSVSARVSHPSEDAGYSPPFLQIIGLGENGIEVHEVPLSALWKGKGKGKSKQHAEVPTEEPVWAEEDLGGETGFLCVGGHWDQSHHLFHRRQLNRSYSASSNMSATSFTSMESEDILEKMKKEEGVYAWCRKGHEDWRVFWIGGSLTGDVDDEDEDDLDA